MPIALRVVSADDYKAWLAAAWKKAKEDSDGFSVVREPQKTARTGTPSPIVEASAKRLPADSE